MTIKKLVQGKEAIFYGIFRILVGLMFFLHGWAKLFGAKPVALVSLMGVAGVIELAVGIMLVLGLWSRLGALLGAVEMLVAYLKVHAFNAWNPLNNGGELALLYFAAFLVVLYHGNGKWSLEKKNFF